MTIAHRLAFVTLILSGCASTPLTAQDPPPTGAPGASPAAMSDSRHDEVSHTNHTVTINGDRITYDATAGYLTLRAEDGTPRADVFYIAYTKDGMNGAERATRPVTFSFNGGPGSSSVWLHLGLLGPKRVDMGDVEDERGLLPPPWKLIENEYSLLDHTDLVFIDPVTTGYSRAAEGQDDKQFHGVSEDVESVGEFVRLWVTRNQRWQNPKFLIGESYGTTRAANLVNWLQNRHGMFFNGVMLVSSILDFQTVRGGAVNDLPYISLLPTFAATAWYHKQLPSDLQQLSLRELLDQVEQFALGEYASALLLGARLSTDDRARITRTLSRYTGLSQEFIELSNLRVDMGRFAKGLMRDEHRTVGRLDSRFNGIDADRAADSYEYDPSMSAIDGPYTATLNHYVRNELGFESDLPYEILTGRVSPWNYEDFEGRYVSVSDFLREAMTENPALRVFIANGYYDMATPYFGTEHTVAHLRLDDSLRGHIEMAYYEAGHMMYVHEPSLIQLKRDLAAFVERTLD